MPIERTPPRVPADRTEAARRWLERLLRAGERAAAQPQCEKTVPRCSRRG
jgi:hypothetical protein